MGNFWRELMGGQGRREMRYMEKAPFLQPHVRTKPMDDLLGQMAEERQVGIVATGCSARLRRGELALFR